MKIDIFPEKYKQQIETELQEKIDNEKSKANLSISNANKKLYEKPDEESDKNFGLIIGLVCGLIAGCVVCFTNDSAGPGVGTVIACVVLGQIIGHCIAKTHMKAWESNNENVNCEIESQKNMLTSQIEILRNEAKKI